MMYIDDNIIMHVQMDCPWTHSLYDVFISWSLSICLLEMSQKLSISCLYYVFVVSLYMYAYWLLRYLILLMTVYDCTSFYVHHVQCTCAHIHMYCS